MKTQQIVTQVMYQLREILYKKLDTKEKRDEAKLTIFTPLCPVCKHFLKDPVNQMAETSFPYTGCGDCFLFPCLEMKTRVKDKSDMEQIKRRLRFWLRVSKELIKGEDITKERVKELDY
jgi:hypothetical protein